MIEKNLLFPTAELIFATFNGNLRKSSIQFAVL